MRNLDKLHEITKKLCENDSRAFRNYVIGSLSVKVKDEVWDEALAVGQVCMHPEPDHECKFMPNGHCEICGESYNGH